MVIHLRSIVFFLILFVIVTSPVSAQTPTEYGFNTFVMVQDPLQDLERFKADAEDAVAHNQQWIRTGIASWEIAPSGDTRHIDWNYTNLAIYDEAISYAKQKGLKIYLITSGAPDWTSFWGNNYSYSNYKKVSNIYWKFLATRYQGKITVWQVFNEADYTHYRYFTPITTLTSSYLNELKGLLAAARTTIRTIDPAILITTNTAGWPMSDAIQTRWFKYFDAQKINLDVITVDVYPVDNVAEIEKLDDRVTAMKNRYLKPVIIGEIGIQTCTTCWTEEDQQIYIPMAVNQLKQANPMAIFVYQMRDRGIDPTSSEGTYGIKYNDGTPKQGYEAVLGAMAN